MTSTPSRQQFPRVPRRGPNFRHHPYHLSHPSRPWVREVQARLERQQAQWILAGRPRLGGLWSRAVRLHLVALPDLAVPTSPCGPAGPTGPCGPASPCGPVGPGSPLVPCSCPHPELTKKLRQATNAKPQHVAPIPAKHSPSSLTSARNEASKPAAKLHKAC